MTYAEKIIARAAGREAVRPGEALFAKTDWRYAHEYVSPAAIAVVHIGLEAYDDALDWAERAYAERRGWLAYLAVNPIFDPMRAMPRFIALVGSWVSTMSWNRQHPAVFVAPRHLRASDAHKDSINRDRR